MTLAHIIAKVGTVKSVLGIIGLATGIVVAASGWLKVPAKQDAIAAAIEDHQAQTDKTNTKLDVLICLQAKLDTPIRCVARDQH